MRFKETKLKEIVSQPPVSTYLLLTLAFFVALQTMNLCMEASIPNYYPMNHLRRFADAMLFALPAFFLYRKRFLFLYLTMADLYILANVWYYRTFLTPMPLTAFFQVENLDGLWISILHSMRLIDLGIFLPVAAFAVCYSLIINKKHRYIGGGISALGFVLCSLIICIIQIPPYFTKTDDFAAPQNIVRFDLTRTIRQYGLTAFWRYQISYLKGCSAEETAFAEDAMQQLKSEPVPEPLVSHHRKNLIIILVESLASWPIGLEVDGIEATPRLNGFIRDSQALYFPKVWPCRKDGRSADAQLIINTGLLPISNGATSTSFGTNTYMSLPKALRQAGYQSVSCITDAKDFWNQGATTKSYGFDELHDKLKGDVPICRWDEHLFSKGFDILTQMQEPFYAQLVTMSMHDIVPTDATTPLDNCNFPTKDIGYHLILTNYTDHHIGLFVDRVKEAGLYDNSIIVIVSDHDAYTYNLYEQRDKCEPEDRFIPLIILNSPLRTDTDRVIAQIDIYPSLLDIMGVENYCFRGLGESVFRGHSNYACSHLGEAGEGGNDPTIRQWRHDMWKLSDILIRTDYFASH